MAATTSTGDITDMDCSPAEIEEFIKEVRLLLTLNTYCYLSFSPRHICTHFTLPWLPRSFCVTFFSDNHTLPSPPTLVAPSLLTLPLGLHDCKVYKGALLTTAHFTTVFLQEEGRSIQASPEYWSQGSINGKTTFSTQLTIQYTLL